MGEFWTRSIVISIYSYFLFFPSFSHSAHIGLFASTGCYSHDVLMFQFANRLSSKMGGNHRVTVIQIRVHRFNRSLASSNSDTPWNQVYFESNYNDESESTLAQLQNKMWMNLVPFDANSFNIDGVELLLKLHKHQMEGCYNALRDFHFMEKIRKLNLDLMVVDYVLNECALHFGQLINVNLVYFSNYPVLSSYAVDLGVSSNPSTVPMVIGFEPQSMSFLHRSFNSFLYFLLWATRQWFNYDANRIFRKGLGHRYFTDHSSRVLAFSTPFEMMADAVRPMTRNLHYFGCEQCNNQDSYGMHNQTMAQILRVSKSSDGIILVTFGTVTKGDRIPVIQLQRLTRIFAHFPSYTFIWQLDVSFDYFNIFVLAPMGFRMPPNVHIFTWIPLKLLLMEKQVVLLISHGGISTCLEALHNAVPILGMALQGDQGYNLRRFVDKGMGEMVPISGFNEKVMLEKLTMMISNIKRYKSAATRLRSMVQEHRSSYKYSSSTFWITWLARHFGRNGRNASEVTSTVEQFLTLRYPSNWVTYYCLDILAIPLFGIFCGLLCISIWGRLNSE